MVHIIMNCSFCETLDSTTLEFWLIFSPSAFASALLQTRLWDPLKKIPLPVTFFFRIATRGSTHIRGTEREA